MSLAEEVAELRRLLPELRALQGGGTNTATISINAGGTALWVAVTCCAVMLAALVPMALGLYWVAMDSRDRGHQMNALYQSTPGLRELVEQQMHLIEQTRKAEQEPKK